ncbi:hypothetical protein GF327_01540 [Candidatus Woesearchaeota archaeon]|nr:hypothetical protein [Candidatus Woesearchaeota archaeon]
MKKVIGVMGSAGVDDKNLRLKAYEIGKHIAKNSYFLLTGATTGLPYEAVKGAKSEGGFVVGISPARNKKSHKNKFNKPIKCHDLIIYTGQGYEGRNLINIRSCDAVIFINGGIGTLNEFTIAYKEGKIIGILDESGGICNLIKEIVDSLYMKSDSVIFFEKDPKLLVEKVAQELGMEANK